MYLIIALVVLFLIVGYQQYQLNEIKEYNNKKITVTGVLGVGGNISFDRDEAIEKCLENIRPEETVNVPLKVPYKSTPSGVYTCYGEANCPPEVLIETKELTTTQALQLVINYLGIKYVSESKESEKLTK
jgi:hypothetical protein